MSTMTSEPGIREPRIRRSSTHSLQPTSRSATLTLGGLMYIVVTVFLAIGAVNAQNNLLFWLFGVAIALLVASGFLSGNALMGLRARPLPIQTARAGELHAIQYSFSNTSRLFPLFGVLVRERIMDTTSYQQHTPGVLIHLSPRSSTRCAAQLMIHARGYHSLDTFRVESSFPFGIIRKWIRFDQHRSFLALPHKLELKPTLIPDRAQGYYDRPTAHPRYGGGTDYIGLRSYVAGDPRKRIAWKQSARRGELVVIEHAQQTSPRVTIVLNRPSFDEAPEMIERAIALVAALATQGIEKRAAVGVSIPWAMVYIAPNSGPAQLSRIEEALAVIDTSEINSHSQASTPMKVGRLLRVSCSHATGNSMADFYADSPEDWLASEAEIPQKLIPGAKQL